ncbi:hypothetical protein Ahy_B05g078478 [Arachis hypogaea]|uniref:Integrase zinc-binding domain-containing protein n=1 Tax=Arachis hypogaea TaxID=3818 RepID=A0A444Z764_ARAHY|nr:hypothetical protein Ahy_B05g078478 [Arachis hypogaea]
MHIMDLGRVKLRQGEGLVAFIKRYRDQALLCIDILPEPQLVYGCIRNVEDGSQIYLSMSNINTFSELLKRASDIAEAMKRNGRRSKEVSPLEVCAADGRGRRSSYSRGAKRNSPLLLLPLSRAQAMVVVNGLFEDETLNPRTDRKPPTPEDSRDPRYCMVHRNKSHGLTDCYVVRTMFHRQVKEGKILLNGEKNQEGVKIIPFPQHDVGMIGVEGEVMLTEIVDEAEEMVTMEESLSEDTLTRGLLKSQGCRIMFNQLGLEPHIQKEVFDKISFEHVPRTENKHVDALATLGSRVTIQNGQHALEHWLRTLNITKETRGFCLFNGKMFRKSSDGLLMKCVGEEEGKEKVEQLHGATCREEGPGLYRRLQRWGIYWLKMKFHCDELQASCKACQETKESTQICNVHNW